MASVLRAFCVAAVLSAVPMSAVQAQEADGVDQQLVGDLYVAGKQLLDNSTGEEQTRLGLRLLERAAEQGASNAAFALGTFYMSGGAGVAADPALARSFLERAVETGHSYAPVVLGQALLNGDKLERDVATGIALLTGQVDAGRNVADAAFVLGSYYLSGEGADRQLAQTYLGKAVGAGHGYAPIVLGQALLKGEQLAFDPAAGIALLEDQIAADRNAADAAFTLGTFFLTGAGDVAADGERARAYLERAMAAGHPLAPVVLGGALLEGDLIDIDASAGLALLNAQIAAGNNIADTAFLIGSFYLTGGGDVAADPARARDYLERAIAAGHGYAPVLLGQALLKGDQLVPDPAAGIALLDAQIADGKNVADAAFNLGSFYLGGGDGVAADPSKARLYLEKAVAAGHGYAPIVLGQELLKGDRITADPAAGVALLEGQVGDGVNIADAAFNLGAFYLTGGGGVAADGEKARAYLGQAIAAGHGYAPIMLGLELLKGDQIAADPAAGIALLEEQIAAGKNVAPAAFGLGTFYLNGGGGIAADGEKARASLERAMAAGHGYAPIVLGQALLKGERIPIDVIAGIDLLEGQAETGNNVADATFALGTFFLSGGGGVGPDGEKALGFLEQAVEAGHGYAPIVLGQMLIWGREVEADPVIGVALLEGQIAEGRNVVDASFSLGTFFLSGNGEVAADGEKALAYLEQAVEGGHGYARVVLGQALLKGERVAGDPAAGIALLEGQIASGRDVADAAFALGSFHLTGGEGADAGKARAYLEQAVAAGHDDAPIVLGEELLTGERLALDPEAGIALLEEISAGDGPEAADVTLALGRFFIDGVEGFPPDAQRAEVYFTRAVALGQSEALVELGEAYVWGKFGEPDGEAAVLAFEQAISGGADSALVPLAELYLYGQAGIAQDIPKGMEILTEAADDGNPPAIAELIGFNLTGFEGVVPPSLAKARALFDEYAELAEPDDVRMQGMLVSGAEREFRQAGEYFVELPESMRSEAIRDLFDVNENAAVYVAQLILTSAEIYSGPTNGLLTAATIKAFQTACRAEDTVGECSSLPLHEDTLAFIAANFA